LKSVIPAIVTHKGAAADSGHYIGFVKKSVFYAANAKAKAVNADLTRKFNQLEELIVNTPLPDSLESGATSPGPMLITSVANSLLNRSLDPGAVESSLLANATQVQGNNDSADSNSAPVPGPSTIDLDAEEDENWYKFDDEKVIEFPKEKLSTLEGGGEDSSAYVLVYRSKVL
jgi:ubiquitin carboxyl-terminal hydrolase 14